MVVCKCRKATKLYCFVHKVPVCGECVTSTEHKLCVVKTYSDWVIDGDYDWPPKCAVCQEALQEAEDVTRLGCLHVFHSHCLNAHLQGFPPHTAPAGYTCPSCSTSVWPPKLVRDSASGLAAKLKEIISQSGLATTLLGGDSSALITPSVTAPPAFSSSPLVSAGSHLAATNAAEENAYTTSTAGTSLPESGGQGASPATATRLTDAGSRIDAEASSSTSPGSSSSSKPAPAPSRLGKGGPPPPLQLLNGTMARKNSMRGEILSPSGSGDFDDEDGSHRKYSRRGPLHQQMLRSLVPLWSPSLRTLPVTTPSRRDSPGAEEIIDGRSRRKQRHTVTFDTRKLLLWFAIMSCMVTVVLLYYRLGTLGTKTAGTTQLQEQ